MYSGISTHILTKRMTSCGICRKTLQCYFNSHPHEEDDHFPHVFLINWIIISTHILTKRMTTFFICPRVLRLISTHILTKRMTLCSRLMVYILLYFNSHPHEEDDYYIAFCIFRICHFNSHPHEEDDLLLLLLLYLLHYFNSHPHEEDD